VQRQINNRDTLLVDYKKKQSKFASQQAKAEQKHTTRDPAVAQKLQQLDADWKATKEHFATQNTKLFKLVPDIHVQLFKALEDQIRTVRPRHTHSSPIPAAFLDSPHDTHDTHDTRHAHIRRRRPTFGCSGR
jgi:hypothetical protein